LQPLCAAVAGAEGTAAGGRAEGGTMRLWKVPTVTTKLNIDWPELQFAFDSTFGNRSRTLAPPAPAAQAGLESRNASRHRQ
jgi:hypothetical protein